MVYEKFSPIIEHPLELYGRTVQGTPLHAILPEKATTLFIAGMHGEEPETTLLTSYALRTIDFDELKVAVIMAANPDGLAVSTRCNSRKVDINRNFPIEWEPGYTYSRWTTEYERNMPLSSGDKPASENETQALMRLIEEHDYETVINFHAPLANVKSNEEHIGTFLAEQTRLPLVSQRDYPVPGTIYSWVDSLGKNSITYEVGLEGKQELRKIHVPVLQKLFTGKY